MKSFALILAITLLSLSLHAQKDFSVKIQFPNNISVKNIKIGFDNGKERKGADCKFVNNQAVINGLQYSKYVTFWILDESKDSFLDWRYFWVNGQNASIIFTTKDSSQNIFGKYILKNAYSLLEVGKEHEQFCHVEHDSYKSFYNTYFTEKFTGDFTDSLSSVQRKLLDTSNNKDLEFIKANNTLYYSFDYFRRNLSGQQNINPDTLYAVFKMFPPEFRESYEGKALGIFLAGKCLTKGSQSPDFSNVDYFTKQAISLQNNTNKYILLVYWASWCKPCIAEIPIIKKIREIYPADKLEIIGITLDADSSRFVKAVEKYGMNWKHIFGDTRIIKSFGVQPIPEVFLIDSTGIIAYKRDEERDYQLEYLQKLLKDKL